MRRRGAALALVLAVGAAMTTGCNQYGYDAHIDSVSVYSTGITVRGWYHDPFLDKRGTLCADVVVLVDGVPDDVDRGCVAADTRLDVELTEGRWAFDFAKARQALSAGRHTACVVAVPPGASLPAPDHCVDFVVPFDQFSRGIIDTAEVAGGRLTVEGWFSHIVTGPSNSFAGVGWQLDGQWVTPDADHTLEVVDRPDVVAAVGPTGRGYRLTATVAPGTHTACLRLTDGTGPVVCRTVVAP